MCLHYENTLHLTSNYFLIFFTNTTNFSKHVYLVYISTLTHLHNTYSRILILSTWHLIKIFIYFTYVWHEYNIIILMLCTCSVYTSECRIIIMRSVVCWLALVAPLTLTCLCCTRLKITCRMHPSFFFVATSLCWRRIRTESDRSCQLFAHSCHDRKTLRTAVTTRCPSLYVPHAG